MPGLFGYSQLERNERRGNGRGNVFGSLKVNPVKAVFGGHIKDSLDKRRTILRSDRRREVTGTSPSTDGDASHRPMCLSLLDKVWKIADPRVVKTQD